MHSNCVCVWVVCVAAVVLIGEVSKHLGSLYNNCDKVESLRLIVAQSCWVIFLLQKKNGKFMTSSLHELQALFVWKVTYASLVFVGFNGSVKTNHFHAASLFSITLFIQWGQPLEVKVCLQILGPVTDAFLSLSFVTVVFCKWQCWVITCVKNQAGRGHEEKRLLGVDGGGWRRRRRWRVLKHQALIGHEALAVWHHWGCWWSTVNKEGNAWMALCAAEQHALHPTLLPLLLQLLSQ